MNNPVVIFSGGVDSTTLLYFVLKQQSNRGIVDLPLVPLSFRYGQRHSREIDAAASTLQDLGLYHLWELVDISGLMEGFESELLGSRGTIPPLKDVVGDPQPPTYVPNRNMIFLSIAAGLAESLGSDTVAYGAQKHDFYGYWDTTPQFITAMQAVFNLNRKTPIKLYAPFAEMSKGEIVSVGLRHNVDYGLTWSCYEGGDQPCGKCATCRERAKAFKDNQMVDPLLAI